VRVQFGACYYCRQSKTASLHLSLSSSTLKLECNLTAAIANDRACFLAFPHGICLVSEECAQPRHPIRATLACHHQLLACLVTVQDSPPHAHRYYLTSATTVHNRATLPPYLPSSPTAATVFAAHPHTYKSTYSALRSRVRTLPLLAVNRHPNSFYTDSHP
jgi:hypothetical protein